MTGFPLGWVPRGPQILRILIAAAVSWQVCEMGAGVRNWKVNDPHALSVVLRRPVRRMEVALRQCVPSGTRLG